MMCFTMLCTGFNLFSKLCKVCTVPCTLYSSLQMFCTEILYSTVQYKCSFVCKQTCFYTQQWHNQWLYSINEWIYLIYTSDTELYPSLSRLKWENVGCWVPEAGFRFLLLHLQGCVFLNPSFQSIFEIPYLLFIP